MYIVIIPLYIITLLQRHLFSNWKMGENYYHYSWFNMCCIWNQFTEQTGTFRTLPVKHTTQNASPILDLSSPILDLSLPILDLSSPILDLSSPILDLSSPILDLSSPILDLSPSILDLYKYLFVFGSACIISLDISCVNLTTSIIVMYLNNCNKLRTLSFT